MIFDVESITGRDDMTADDEQCCNKCTINV